MRRHLCRLLGHRPGPFNDETFANLLSHGWMEPDGWQCQRCGHLHLPRVVALKVTMAKFWNSLPPELQAYARSLSEGDDETP